MSASISPRDYLSPSELRIEGKRLLIGSQDKRGVALVSTTLFEKPKDTFGNKILKFLGFGYWTVLAVKQKDNSLTYYKVNGNSLRKFAEMNPRDFKERLKSHQDLNMTEVLTTKVPKEAEKREEAEKKEEASPLSTPLKPEEIVSTEKSAPPFLLTPLALSNVSQLKKGVQLEFDSPMITAWTSRNWLDDLPPGSYYVIATTTDRIEEFVDEKHLKEFCTNHKKGVILNFRFGKNPQVFTKSSEASVDGSQIKVWTLLHCEKENALNPEIVRFNSEVVQEIKAYRATSG